MKVQTVLVCTDYNDNKANPTVHNSLINLTTKNTLIQF